MKINIRQWRSMEASERVAMIKFHISEMAKGWVK